MNRRELIAFDPDAHMDSETVQFIAYLLKCSAHRYEAMNGKQALEFAADALLKADLDVSDRSQ